MKRPSAFRAAVIAIAMTAAFALSAAAASLGAVSGTLAAGTSAVDRCNADGVATRANLSGTDVVSVTVSGIAAACGGLTLKATVTGATSSEGSTTIAAGGGSATVTLAAGVALVQSLRIDLAVSTS